MWGGDSATLVVFGSPERDVHEMAGGRLGGRDMIRLNFFPKQRTRTVRLEGGHAGNPDHTEHGGGGHMKGRGFLILCMGVGAACAAIGGITIWSMIQTLNP